MAKQQRLTNGAMQTALTQAINTPIVPVKTEQQLLLEAEIERLKAENERLAAAKASSTGLSIRRSEKGAVSVYGLGRWPVTLYLEQWLKLLAMADQIKGFIKENERTLSHKGDQ